MSPLRISCFQSITCGLLMMTASWLYSAEPYAKFKSPLINESSGLIKSRTWPNVYWTHNDSGDQARIFAVRRTGSLVQPEWYKEDYRGIRIEDAVNIDWEEIAMDDSGNLAIGAFGNNGNARRDLAIYLLPEPNPYEVIATRVAQQIRFRYPDQSAYPPKKRNFDAEAFFYAYGHFYLLTKHRSDTQTKLYRFDTLKPNEENLLSLIQSFDIQGMVTAADYDTKHQLLAVLTYDSIWLFKTTPESLMGGQHYRFPLKNTKQCEGLCFDGDKILISNEQTELFEFSIQEIMSTPTER